MAARRRGHWATSNFPRPSGAALGMEQYEISPAILRPGSFVVLERIRQRLVLAIADGADAHRVNAGLGQRLAQRLGATFAERAIILFRAALVAISFDEQFGARIGFQGR